MGENAIDCLMHHSFKIGLVIVPCEEIVALVTLPESKSFLLSMTSRLKRAIVVGMTMTGFPSS